MNPTGLEDSRRAVSRLLSQLPDGRTPRVADSALRVRVRREE